MRHFISGGIIQGLFLALTVQTLAKRTRSEAPQQSGTILLGYVRLSNDRTEEERGQVLRPEPDANGNFHTRRKPNPGDYPMEGTSKERQKANIQKMADREGLTIEYYEDVGGLRSGRSTKQRPGWQQLERRLSDPDVAGLIVNDLSRAHRRSVSLLQLLELLEKHHKRLYLADPERSFYGELELDSFLLKLIAILDEWYAEDNAIRQRSRARARAEHGITGGMPPFGTYRQPASGQLARSQRGAWWIAEWGQYSEGIPSEIPHSTAIWRTYAQTAERILRLFGEERYGYQRIALTLNAEGYPFQNRRGHPRPVTGDDVRRVVNNWSTYGGLVGGGRSRRKEDPTWKQSITAIRLVMERAVFPANLLQKVARRQQQNQAIYGERRLRVEAEHGVVEGSACYPLRGILHCRACVAAKQSGTPTEPRGWLGGSEQRHVRRYRHQATSSCGCKVKSVPAWQLERAVGKYLAGVQLRPDARTRLKVLLRSLHHQLTDHRIAARQREQEQHIRHYYQRIQTLKACFESGDCTAADYHQRVETLRAQITQWQQVADEAAQVTPTRILASLGNLGMLWQQATPPQQKKLAHALFEQIVYDMDEGRIVAVAWQPLVKSLLILPELPQ